MLRARVSVFSVVLPPTTSMPSAMPEPIAPRPSLPSPSAWARARRPSAASTSISTAVSSGPVAGRAVTAPATRNPSTSRISTRRESGRGAPGAGKLTRSRIDPVPGSVGRSPLQEMPRTARVIPTPRARGPFSPPVRLTGRLAAARSTQPPAGPDPPGRSRDRRPDQDHPRASIPCLDPPQQVVRSPRSPRCPRCPREPGPDPRARLPPVVPQPKPGKR